jgi:chromosome segregation ATPase
MTNLEGARLNGGAAREKGPMPAVPQGHQTLQESSVEIGLIIVLGVLLAGSLAFNLGLFGTSKPKTAGAVANTSSSAAPSRSSDDDRARKLESELEKKRKDLEEAKKASAELKDELKAAKKKLFDAGQADKNGDDLSKARAEVERQASIQLESTRAELATALADVQRLKAAEEKGGKKRAAPADESRPVAEKPVVEKVPEVVTRVIRELSEVEKERIARLETQSANDRKKANELDRELKSLRAKVDRMHRESKRVYAESNLVRDKFRAVEVRLNRTLLENDLFRRAISDLEKKTGQRAEHVTPTADEVADADRKLSERHAAEDRAENEARERLEAAPVTMGGDDAPAATETAPVATEPVPAATPTASA